jgi:hypothetical protein
MPGQAAWPEALTPPRRYRRNAGKYQFIVLNYQV